VTFRNLFSTDLCRLSPVVVQAEPIQTGQGHYTANLHKLWILLYRRTNVHVVSHRWWTTSGSEVHWPKLLIMIFYNHLLLTTTLRDNSCCLLSKRNSTFRVYYIAFAVLLSRIIRHFRCRRQRTCLPMRQCPCLCRLSLTSPSDRRIASLTESTSVFWIFDTVRHDMQLFNVRSKPDEQSDQN